MNGALHDNVSPAMSRREFARLLGPSMALAGTGACVDPPRGDRLPYARQPPEIVPGVPVTYATAHVLDGTATGLLVETREGRPIKVEGNPAHPASVGAAGILEQATLLQLHDSSRARSVRGDGRARSWTEVAQQLRNLPRDTRLRIVMPPVSSPLTLHLLDRIAERYPGSRTHHCSAWPLENIIEGGRLGFDRPLVPLYDLAAADVIVALDADVLSAGPFHLRHARDFATRRRITSADDSSRHSTS